MVPEALQSYAEAQGVPVDNTRAHVKAQEMSADSGWLWVGSHLGLAKSSNRRSLSEFVRAAHLLHF